MDYPLAARYSLPGALQELFNLASNLHHLRLKQRQQEAVVE
jgi:hypothetical protein